MKKRFLSFSMAVCMVCLLTMTSCSAAEIPAVSSGNGLDSAKLTSEAQPTAALSDFTPGAWYSGAIKNNRTEEHTT